VSRIELPPPVVKERVFKLKTPALKKNDKAPADLAVVFNDGGKEEFNSQLVRAAKDAIIKRAQEAHVPVVIASGIEFRSPAPLHRPDSAPGFDRMEEMRERSRTKTN
jgi:hypothetical protein